MTSKRFLNVDDICAILGRKQTYCYKVIRDLNKELEEQGYYVTAGRVPARYFYERTGIQPQ